MARGSLKLIIASQILPISTILSGQLDFLSVAVTLSSIVSQVDLAGWGALNTKLKGLSQPALGSMIIAKHLHYAGRDEFNFAQVEDEYLKFSRTKLVGSGRTRWPVSMLRLVSAFYVYFWPETSDSLTEMHLRVLKAFSLSVCSLLQARRPSNANSPKSAVRFHHTRSSHGSKAMEGSDWDRNWSDGEG